MQYFLFTILFFNGVFFPYMLLTEQVKAKMKYICFLKSFHGNPDCKVFSLNQPSLHLVGRPTSRPWLSWMGPWLHLPASLGLKERWENKLSASSLESWSLNTASASAFFGAFLQGVAGYVFLQGVDSYIFLQGLDDYAFLQGVDGYFCMLG